MLLHPSLHISKYGLSAPSNWSQNKKKQHKCYAGGSRTSPAGVDPNRRVRGAGPGHELGGGNTRQGHVRIHDGGSSGQEEAGTAAGTSVVGGGGGGDPQKKIPGEGEAPPPG